MKISQTQASTDSQKLCLSCGLCCNGTLFKDAVITDLEATQIKEFVTIDSGKKEKQLMLPCKALKNNCCSIYNQRPAVCKKYECKLVKSLASKETSFDSALSTIQSTKKVINEINQYPPLLNYDAVTLDLFGRIKQFEDDSLQLEDDTEFRKKHATLLLKAYLLRKKLFSHFGVPYKKGSENHSVSRP